MGYFEYVTKNMNQIFLLLIDHIQLTSMAVLFAILIGVPLGILISYYKKLNKPIIGLSNIIQAIPSMALLGLSIPLLGIGTIPAVTMVILYSLLPIIKNSYTGITSINQETVEAAEAIGLTKFQILFKIQIPLALPVIMAGIRISAVTAVGLMTMAAFIGGGGLGFLIFSGIRTVNNNQILAGAIPACLLALFVDFIFSQIEKLVTPISLQNIQGNSKKKLHNGRKRQKLILTVSAIALIITFTITGIINNMSTEEMAITVAGKDFTEQSILTHMISDLIEDRTDIFVKREANLGGTQVCFGALKTGNVDMYIEYTGTAYGDTLNYPPNSDMNEVYNTVKEKFDALYNIEVLPQMSFNNTYTLAVTQETIEKYNLHTISDLSKISNQLVAGTTLEFLNREDGIPGLKKLYNFKFKEEVGIDGSPRYVALTNKKTDVVDAFATDGLLKKFELVVLEDDKNFFPPYYAIPIIRSETLEKYPEIEPLMIELGSILTDDIMIELNYNVDELQMNPRDVAHEFLVKQGLLMNN